jgi:hypothetical protein
VCRSGGVAVREKRTGKSACATRGESPAKLTGVRGSDILFVPDYIAKEH